MGGQNAVLLFVFVFILLLLLGGGDLGGGGCNLTERNLAEKTSRKFLKFSFLKSLQMHQILATFFAL